MASSDRTPDTATSRCADAAIRLPTGAAAGSPADLPARPTPLLGWRWLALFYDLWPAAALWMAASAVFLTLHRDQPLAAFSPLQWLLWGVCWLLTGAYAIVSWRRGGQTLGMRPWRLRVVDLEGNAPTWRAAALRYLVGTASLLLGGLGFWWAWVARDRLTWHDRASGTRMRREAR